MMELIITLSLSIPYMNQRLTLGLIMVVHSCNLSFSACDNKRITVQAHSRQKFDALSEKQTNGKRPLN
jgi:hypothetical protein